MHWIYQEVEMSTGSIIVLVVVAVVVVAAGTVLTGQLRRRRLRERFGPEYDRVVHTADDRRAAERVLKEREQRHAKFELRPLSDQSRQGYQEDWSRVQERFVDAPAEAVADAERLVTVVLAEIGYPTQDFEQQAADLSVRHAEAVEPYRRAHGVLTEPEHDGGSTDTDHLRRALLDYRAVFDAVAGRGETVSRTHA